VNLREQLVAKNMADCRHFNGIQHDCCNAGINYEELIEHGKYRIPCLKMAVGLKRDPAICGSFEAMTREEAEADADSSLDRQNKTMLAVSCAHEAAKKKGFGAGRGGVGSITCPVCQTGTISYSVASVNGHMWGKCSTKGCVSWME
jgi:hypothetical protein